jgi:hypothetical protein
MIRTCNGSVTERLARRLSRNHCNEERAPLGRSNFRKGGGVVEAQVVGFSNIAATGDGRAPASIAPGSFISFAPENHHPREYRCQ